MYIALESCSGEPCLGEDGEDVEDGQDEIGLRSVGVVAPIGVPVLEGSWLAMGVISVPMSLMETEPTEGPCVTYGPDT